MEFSRNIILISLLILVPVISSYGVLENNRFNYDGESLNLLNVKDWVYQLQNVEPGEIAESGFDLIVMDYSYDGTVGGEYSKEEIQTIRDGNVIPIAYISIGEAEDYRFYWKKEWSYNPPNWLGRENPEWEGNYPVKYWVEEWRNIIFSYLDKIISQGFAGIYLDKIDSFEYWSDPDNGEDIVLTERGAAVKMINFVLEIAEYCRNTKGLTDFYIIPQNGENILEYDENGTYLEVISGIGVEDLWYNGLIPNSINFINERINYIDLVANADKIVLSVDYVDDGTGYKGENEERINDYVEKARSKGYIPYAAKSDRELDEINIINGIQPYKPQKNSIGFSVAQFLIFTGLATLSLAFIIFILKKRLR